MVGQADDRTVTRRVVAGAGLAVLGAAAAARPVSPAMAQGDGTPGGDATPTLSGGVAVDPQMREVLDALAAYAAPPIEDVTPQVARGLPSIAVAVRDVLSARGEPAAEPVGGISHVLIPGPSGDDLVARVYAPLDAGDDALPVAVYFYGGGFVLATLDTCDASCRALANAAGCLVVSVAYRQAPEAPYPAAVDDAYAATQWVIENAAEITGDPERVAVVGEGAGGNLATVVSLLARDLGGALPVHQVLIYPVVTFAPTDAQGESIDQFSDATPLNGPMLGWFGSHYLPDPAAAESDPYVSPALADLTGLPPATVILAEIDPLHSQGDLYARQLADAGVDTTVTTFAGVTHEFFGTGAVVDKAMDAVAEVAGRLRTAFGTDRPV